MVFISSPIIFLQQSTFNPECLHNSIGFNGSTHMLRYIKIVIESSTLLSQDLSGISYILLNRLIYILPHA